MIDILKLLNMFSHMLKKEGDMTYKETLIMEKGFLGGLIALGLNTEDTNTLTKELIFLRLERFKGVN